MSAQSDAIEGAIPALASLANDPTGFIDEVTRRINAAKSTLLDPVEFLESDRYLGQKGVLWPRNRDTYREICLDGKPETILTGGIGWGKNTLVSPVLAYFVYELSRQTDPHAYLGLGDRTSEILIVFQSDTLGNANDIGYARFRALVERSPYFNDVFPYDKSLKSRTVFPNRIEVLPVAGDGGGIRGRNVVSGCIDELAYMEVITKSRRAEGLGTFDQAEMLYATMARRRVSRFLKEGALPGHLFLVSSKNYRGQFLEKKIEEAKDNPDRIALFDRRIWDVDPGRYRTRCCECDVVPQAQEGEMSPVVCHACAHVLCADCIDGTFRVFVGDAYSNPRVLKEGEKVPKEHEHLVEAVPDDPSMRTEFDRDVLGSVRDVLGVSTNALNPFILRSDLVGQCFGVHPGIFNREWADLHEVKLRIDVESYPFLDEPHALHVDLALTQDAAGLSLGCVIGFVEVKRGTEVETWPVVHVAGIVALRAPPNGEISFADVRRVIYALQELGVNVKWTSFDSWQSVDMRQQLKVRGFRSQLISMDKTVLPYQLLKDALYDGRVRAPAHALCQSELLQLERDVTNPKSPKIDHPSGGSKDCSDALAGVVYSLSRKRELWIRHQVPLVRIPEMLQRKAED